MKIHSLNYEAYAIDYLEGNLSPSDKKKFELFLAENPQVQKELNELHLFMAEPDMDIEYTDKKGLMKPVAASKAGVFRLPSWAIAACWAVVVASMVFWLWGVQTETNTAIALEPIELKADQDDSEREIEIVQVDVSQLKNKIPSLENEKTDIQPEFTPDLTIQEESLANAVNTEIAPNQKTENIQKIKDFKLEKLPVNMDMQVYAQTPETVYYRPLKKLKLDPEQEELLPQSERESKIALMTPLKKVMRPEDYKRINEFSLMDDVINEIDGREIADAFTPEFLKNNLK